MLLQISDIWEENFVCNILKTIKQANDSNLHENITTIYKCWLQCMIMWHLNDFIFRNEKK